MKILVLGCGNIGSVVAKDLAQSLPSTEFVLADMDKNRAEETVSKIRLENVSAAEADAHDQTRLVNTLKKFDLAVGALPGEMGYQVCKSCIAAGVDLVDVSYMLEDVMTINKAASDAQITVIPDCGMSPGLGNILIGHSINQLDQADTVHILNGGLPDKPLPPLDYVITWSVHDLIDMYSRKVHIVEKGKVVEVEPMSGLEQINFPSVGKLEAFYTDGLRTLLHTTRGVEEMWEKTLRYPGHVQKIKLLKSLGFFDENPLKLAKLTVSPKEVMAKLFENKLKLKDVPDIVIMQIEVIGKKDGKKVTLTCHLLDRYDAKQQITAMARTTAYTASVVAQLLASKAIKEKGVIPPEKLGINKEIYSKFIDMMKGRNIIIKKSTQMSD